MLSIMNISIDFIAIPIIINHQINGHSRILRYLPYIRPMFQAYVREYPQKISDIPENSPVLSTCFIHWTSKVPPWAHRVSARSGPANYKHRVWFSLLPFNVYHLPHVFVLVDRWIDIYIYTYMYVCMYMYIYIYIIIIIMIIIYIYIYYVHLKNGMFWHDATARFSPPIWDTPGIFHFSSKPWSSALGWTPFCGVSCMVVLTVVDAVPLQHAQMKNHETSYEH